MTRRILAPGLCAALAACAQPDARNAADVKATEAGLLAAHKARDAARVGSFYAPDAEVTVPYAAPAAGSDVARSTAEHHKDPAFALDFVNSRTEVAPSGDLAWSTGSYAVTFTNPANQRPATRKGRYMTVFRKTVEGWKIVADMATPGPAEN